MSKTSILAETLAEIQQIKEGIEKNANHVLKNTFKTDLEEIVKNGLEEEEDDNIESNDMMGDDSPLSDFNPETDNTEELPTDDLGIDSSIDPENSEVIDLTDEPLDKVIDTFDRMQLTDEIEIVKTPEGKIQINIDPEGIDNTEMGGEMGAEMNPEMGSEMGDDMSPEMSPEMGDDMGSEMGGEMSPEMGDEPNPEDDDETIKEGGEEVVYEIEISDEKPVSEETTDEKEIDEDVKHVVAKASMKHNTEELHESLVSARKKIQALMVENKNYKKELNEVKGLVDNFKLTENEYKSAIKTLKDELKEVALYTSNLTYSVKLMTENSTTKDEKLDIIKRFDKAKNLTESREIYNNLETLFNSSKKVVEKTIEEKVLKSNKSSGATNLNESTAYKNPQLNRILEIMGKIK